jgi:hypothetical protein
MELGLVAAPLLFGIVEVEHDAREHFLDLLVLYGVQGGNPESLVLRVVLDSLARISQ